MERATLKEACDEAVRQEELFEAEAVKTVQVCIEEGGLAQVVGSREIISLPIVGRTQPVTLVWGHARCRTTFLVLGGLEGVKRILGMDVLGALRVLIDTRECTVNPRPPPPSRERKLYRQDRNHRGKCRHSTSEPQNQERSHQ